MAFHLVRTLRNGVRPILGEASSSRTIPMMLPSAAPVRMLHSSMRLADPRERTKPLDLIEDDGYGDQSAEEAQPPQPGSLLIDPTSDSGPNEPPQLAYRMQTMSPDSALPGMFLAQPEAESDEPAGKAFGTRPASLNRSGLRPGGMGANTSTLGGGMFGRMRSRPPHRLFIQSTRNNCLISLTNHEGRIIKRETSGTVGFKRAARSGYEAAYRVAMAMVDHIQTNQVKWGVASLEVIFNGMGQGRDASFRALQSTEATLVRNLVRSVSDDTPIKIGGTRPKKRRML